jgi:hypothetical protein
VILPPLAFPGLSTRERVRRSDINVLNRDNQGMITGVRGLCNGLGPAMFGLIFSLFHVDLNEKVSDNGSSGMHRPPTQDVTFANQECIL